MMNSQHQSLLPQISPAVPLADGRAGYNGPYPHGSLQPPYYPGYPYQYSMRPPQQWTPYNFPPSVPRAYQPYPPMSPYPIPQHIPPMRPSPHQTPSSSSVRSGPGVHSPPPPISSLHPPLSTPITTAIPHLAPPTPPPPPPPSSVPASTHRTPFYPPLPWQSFEGAFPARAPRRRRRTPAPQSSSAPVQLPSRGDSVTDEEDLFEATPSANETIPSNGTRRRLILETPPSSHPPSEDLSTQPTTPSSAAPPQQHTPKISASGRPNIPIVPIVPALPHVPKAQRPPKGASISASSRAFNGVNPSNAGHLVDALEATSHVNEGENDDPAKPAGHIIAQTVKAPPKSWADLVRTRAAPTASSDTQVTIDAEGQANGFVASKAGSLAGALISYNVEESSGSAKVAFLEPRGLVNTGNMCYMNSILQILVFCVPFYGFLDRIGNQAVHSFKSHTPLVDAMIMFMREFHVIDAAVSVGQLRMRLKDTELEHYGEAFIPEFVYEVIRRIPRFSSMRRGHQQDAEEFLGFLLEEMHVECDKAMKSANTKSSSGTSTPTNGDVSSLGEATDANAVDEGGWLEVGPKQKAAITRSSGAIATESPVTKIFGGKLRSEFRVPGLKSSVTLEPYQPLQLDIGAPNVSNIIDALKGLTKPETLHGEFNSPRGPGSTATKQIFIETLPQVLILHLKRFQYNSNGGTQKIWRKVGYPLDLEIPKEVFPQHKRGGFLAHGGLPKYRLIGVVYHHGKNASGGHYTVDVRRQEGREWIRIDDTIIRRIRSEDVAEGGSEEDPKVLAAALEQHKNDSQQSSNVYEQFAAEDEPHKDVTKGWNQVNGWTAPPLSVGKKWSGVANGKVTPTNSSGKMTPIGRTSIRDNKVAYILFYQRINA